MAIITTFIDDTNVKKICEAVQSAGRPAPIWYPSLFYKGVSAEEVVTWLEKTQSGQEERDLVTDINMSRGWEGRTVIVVNRSGGFDVNMGMRAVSRLVNVEVKFKH